MRNADALLARLPPGCRGRLLEIGCACGFLLLAARRRGFAVEGIEPSRQAVEHGRRRYGLAIQCARIEEAAIAAGAYDAVVMADTIEHLPQPAAAVARAHVALRAGGVLLLLTPDLGSWTARCAGRFWWGLLDDHHVYFTRRSLSLLLSAHGFAVERMAAFGRRFPLEHWAAKLAQYNGRFGGVAGRLLRATPIGRCALPINLGDQMVCVARKR